MRALSPALADALETGIRQPAYRLLAFDPSLDDWAAIIAESYTQTPLDLTEYAENLSWSDAQLSFVLADDSGRFHPDTGADAGYLRDGAIIRLKEGDERVAETDWVWTFTGAIKGQLGWSAARRSTTLQAQVSAYGRDNTQAFKRRKIVSQKYSAGTDLGIMFRDLATDFMGLSLNEILVPELLGRHFLHKTNQAVQISPWEALSAILEVVSAVPFFTGEGKLSYWSKNLNRSPDLVLPDYLRVYDLQAPARTGDVVNKVVVKFLDSRLSEVEGSYQCLGTASITTGFFTNREVIPCYWSADRKQRAKQTRMIVKKSVNDNLLPVGQESYTQKDAFHGEITIEIYPWVPALVVGLMADYIVATMVLPDEVIVPVGSSVGWTIPWGRAAQAADLIAILTIMASLGSAQYEIWGVPYDMAYLQKKSIAIEDGLDYWEEIELVIENDWIGSHDQADAVAVTELIYQKSAGNLRRLVMDDCLQLEIGDIVQIPDGRRYFITKLSKSLERGQVPILTADCFKVLSA